MPDLAPLIEYYNSIPKDPQENIDYRIKLHEKLAKDKEGQDEYWRACRLYPPIAFATLFWTLDPNQKPGYRNRPFIPRPKQIDVIMNLDWCIRNGHDYGIRKTREEGATEIVAKLFGLHTILYPDTNFIVGSRNEKLVDNLGDNYTLFAKIDHVFKYLMPWMGIQVDRKHMVLKVLNTNSTIVGETTNESFAAGGRATALFLDEFGRVDATVAKSIEGSVHDVSRCIVYGSTHWLGENHQFNLCLEKSTTKTDTLLWWENPVKSEGLYTSPEPGLIELLDLDYYINKHSYFKDHAKFKLDELPEIGFKFVADGGLTIPKNVRSPWHDFQEEKRRGDRRDFMCNVWGEALGSSAMVFDELILKRIKKETICSPNYEGELQYETNPNGTIKSTWFAPNLGLKRLRWWGQLKDGRPNQDHNYILGIDIAMGHGSSNSIIAVYDVNTHKLVGSWACPNTEPMKLADTTIALAAWIGGTQKPYLIWESNGPGGKTYADRIIWHGYYNVYTQRREDSKTRKKVQKWGWHSTTDYKAALLGDLGIALSEGLMDRKTYKAIIIHDEELLNELKDYVYSETGKETFKSRTADWSSGARERHGDRVIAAALCVLGCKEQGKGQIDVKRVAPRESFQYRWEQWKEENEKNKQRLRTYRFR